MAGGPQMLNGRKVNTLGTISPWKAVKDVRRTMIWNRIGAPPGGKEILRGNQTKKRGILSMNRVGARDTINGTTAPHNPLI